MVQPIVSLEEFKAEISSGKKIAIDFWATWCGPCRAISPHFEKLAGQYQDITFLKVDVDEAAEIGQEVGIRAMPTFMTFQNGNKIGELVGAVPGKLTDLISELAAA